MIIDLTKLVTGLEDEILIDSVIDIDKKYVNYLLFTLHYVNYVL